MLSCRVSRETLDNPTPSAAHLLAVLVLQLALAPHLVVEAVLVGLLLAVDGVQLLQVARRLPRRLHLQLLVFADLRII